MGVLDFLMPPQECPAPITLPDSLEGLLDPTPPLSEPPPPPTRQALLEAAVIAAALIAESLQDDEECKECDPCKAVAFGKEYVRSYGDIRTARVGYEYQHHVVNWFFHDPVNRFIMEWELGGVKFDGLDPEEGAKLAIRAIARPEYDPTFTSHCYLIEAKYGYDWFDWDPVREEWKLSKPDFLMDSTRTEITSQSTAITPHYPNVALVWIFSNRHFKAWADTNLIRPTGNIGIRSVYYPYIASEDRS